MTNGTSQGLFIIVAVIIFGIFVLISYLLFGDKLKTGLANIFDDSLEQVEYEVTGIIKSKPLTGQEEDEQFIYAKIRTGSGDDTDIWGKFQKESNNELTLLSVNNDNNKENYSAGLGINGNTPNSSGTVKNGSLVIPNTINGKKVTKIGDNAFRESSLNGTFSAPSVREVGESAFLRTVFTGDFDLPNIETIGSSAFYASQFNGMFLAPKVKTISDTSFQKSIFIGTFNAPNVQYIGVRTFYSSKFTGDFVQPNIITVGDRAFYSSNFNGIFNCPNVYRVDDWAFINSKFTSVTAPELVVLGTKGIGMSNNTYYKLP